MCQWYLSILWISCSSLPADIRVLTFQVPIEMFSLPLIFLTFETRVAHLSPTPQCPLVCAVIFNPGCSRSGIKVFSFLSGGGGGGVCYLGFGQVSDLLRGNRMFPLPLVSQPFGSIRGGVNTTSQGGSLPRRRTL